MAGRDHLEGERKNAAFDVHAMTALIYGGKDKAEKWRKLAVLVAEDPVFRKDDKYSLSRPEAFKRALEKTKQVYKRVHELGLDDADSRIFRALVDELQGADLHHGMFIPTIEGQGTEEQKAKWLSLAKSYAILGCYAQTEMGHGSNVQGLETTADYDPATQEFVINSPTLTSTKWWPGGLGKFSTHAVVFARLRTKGEDHGVHPFIVQLRSLENHRSLPGITVGDIGTKFGLGAYFTVDNGLLRLDHVRVPRDQLLMRYAQVSPDGTYSKPPHAKLAYGAMVYVRAGIVEGAGHYLAKAVTIATRYNAVRRQFGGKDGVETQIIDYKTQQHRLFPLLASAYAFTFTGKWMRKLYTEVIEQLNRGDVSGLPEVHASTAGLKALTTGFTADGIEECRKLCGGNGYLMASGLPDLYCAYVPACTYEGDNYILFLQVARYLMKVASLLASGERPSGAAEYLGDAQRLCSVRCPAESAADFLRPEVQLEALSARAARMVVGNGMRIQGAENFEKAIADSAVEMVRMARAHCQQIVVSKFIEELQGEIEGRGVREQLVLLCNVYAVSQIEANLGDLLEVGYLQPKQAGWVHEALAELLTKVRPHAVNLVDAFNFSDHYLGSALGRYDGDVYTDLYARAWREPLNQTDVVDGYEEHIRPLIKQQVWPVHSRL